MQLHPDDWLSEMLGRQSFHLDLPRTGVDHVALTGFLRSITPPAFVDCRLDVGDVEGVVTLQQAGARLLDTAMTFECTSPIEPGDAAVRKALAEDAEEVTRIARSAFTYSRFARDPLLGNGINARLKAAWAGNFFKAARGDRMLVVDGERGLAGFLLLIDRHEGSVIDLVAVDPAHRGRGVARSLIAKSRDGSKGSRLRVGTQLANAPSIGLYERLGFRFLHAAHVFHLHLLEGTS